MRTVRLALAQMNAAVGDLDGNSDRIIEYVDQAREAGADIVAFPEMAIPGYPPEDLLLKPGFVRRNQLCLERVAAACQGITAVVGFVDANSDIYNAAAVIHDGEVVGVHHKIFLPNYGVFDEDRYFQRGHRLQTFTTADGLIFGVGICEDLWYPDGPAHFQALLGDAQLIINLNASPFVAAKWELREKMLATRASDNTCFIAYLNMVGGQDELVFDGQSVIVDPRGRVRMRGPAFEERLLLADLEVVGSTLRSRLLDPRRRKRFQEFTPASALQKVMLPPLQRREKLPLPPSESCPPPGKWEEIYLALQLGVRDYVDKNRFKTVVIGLSGGIDSALTACLAADALGPERVTGVSMPSMYNISASFEDAKELAENLGIEFLTVPISQPFEALKVSLGNIFGNLPEDTTEENMQARIRGNILMALSNKFGHLVLTTGNKSELACGYCTLYGDMAGGFAVIKDVPKTWVYELSRYRNSLGRAIPERTITRPPSAELRPDQTDQDSLPPYDLLDAILCLYIEEDYSQEEIVEAGFDQTIVQRIISLVDRNEYKRRQGAPGIKITPRAFGKDRRLPITNRYRD